MKSDIFCRRCPTGKLGTHLANELCQPLSKIEDANCLKSHRQRHFITDMSSTPNATEKSKEHCAQSALGSHRSRCNDQCGSLERSRHISPQSDDFLICKYIDGDKYHNHPTEKKQNPNKKFRNSEIEQSAVENGGTGDCCMSDDEMPLSSAVKRLYQPKSVSFYVPDLGTAKKVDAATNSSSKMKASKKSDSEGNGKERKLSRISACLGGKENKLNGKGKIKAKKQDSIMVKLNLHPFQKVRVHPEERSPKENTEQIPPGQHGTLTEPHQKLLHASKKNTIKRRKNPEFSAAAQKTSDSSKEVISSRASVNKLPENGNITATCISSPSKNNSAIRITEGTSPASHLQAPNYISDSPSLSPNGTSIMTVSVNALSSDNTISQNTASDIPTILVSSEALMEDVPDTAFLSCHQESLKTATKLQMPDGMTGANNMENYDTKRVNENPERNNELYRTFASDALIASVVLREESIQTEEQWAHNENKVFQKSMVKVSILSNISSLSSNPEVDRNVSDVHMNNESDKLEVPNNQFDEGSREHEDGKVPPEPSVLSEYKVISYGEEAEKSLIPCSTNKAEICVLTPTQSATSADYDKELPLQMGQSKISFSNNNYPSLLCYKDKKPFSI